MSKTRLRRSDPQKERHWRELIRGQQLSGESVREYCRGAGVKESAFYWWRRELARRGEAPKVTGARRPAQRKRARSSVVPGGKRAAESNRPRQPGRGKPATETPVSFRASGGDASRFLPVHLLGGNSPAHAAGVEIHLGDGRMICVRPGFDRQTLREVLAALEGRPC